MPFFSRVFRSKDSGTSTQKSKKKLPQSNGAVPAPPPKPHWDDAWTRKEVEPEEIQELLRGCTHELKSRGILHGHHSTPGTTMLTDTCSARHALSPPSLPTCLRSQRCTHVRQELLQHGQGGTAGWRPPRTGINAHRTNGEWAARLAVD